MSNRLITENDLDVLTDVWETLRLRGSIFFRSALAAPWGIALPQQGVPRFHICLSGNFFVGSDGSDAIEVKAGQIALIPRGGAHWIADQENSKLTDSTIAGEACELGTPLFQHGDLTNEIMCGLVQFDLQLPHPIFSSLPEIVLFDWLEKDGRVWTTAQLLQSEMDRSNRRTGPIVDRLTEILLYQLLEEYRERLGEITGFVGALGDRRVHKALQLIHNEIDTDWTLTSLGERVGMSRTTLVRQFQEVVGEPPMTYLTNWRLTKAHNLVRHTALPLEDIAAMVGFASARTLNKAFKRCFSVTPKEMRRGK